MVTPEGDPSNFPVALTALGVFFAGELQHWREHGKSPSVTVGIVVHQRKVVQLVLHNRAPVLTKQLMPIQVLFRKFPTPDTTRQARKLGKETFAFSTQVAIRQFI